MTVVNLAQHGESTEPRHDEIQKDAVYRGRIEEIQGLVAVESHKHFVACVPDGFGQKLSHRGLVINHQDSHGRRVITNLTPPRWSR